MKALFYILLSVAILFSCKKEVGDENRYGTVLYKINFTTDRITLKSIKKGSDTLHSNFGDYITSLSPSKFTAISGQ